MCSDYISLLYCAFRHLWSPLGALSPRYIFPCSEKKIFVSSILLDSKSSAILLIDVCIHAEKLKQKASEIKSGFDGAEALVPYSFL
jgi:hypothetical protein